MGKLEHKIFFLIKSSRKILRTKNFDNIKFFNVPFLTILPEIVKIYVAKRIGFLCSSKSYYRKIKKMHKFEKLMSQKLFKILSKKKERKGNG